MDADDELIGSQVLKLFNALYQSQQDLWLVYTNNLAFDDQLRQPMVGVSKMLETEHFKIHTIRLHTFTISNLRTFSRRLFMKIDPKDFRDEKGVFYRWVADFFIYAALA